MHNKFGIIIPYRDRKDQLKQLTKHLAQHVKVPYELIVVEQFDDNSFNRGKLLNIGYEKSKMLECTHLILHDVDLLPVSVDYKFTDHTVHLCKDIKTSKDFTRDNFDEYIGGVTMMPISVFEAINGYTNEFYGWGFEDDELLLRLDRTNQKLDTKIVEQKSREGKSIKVNPGSYVKIPNMIKNNKDYTIFINFSIDRMLTDAKEIADIQSIFSIPGWDTTLSYDSFKHLSFQFWKSDLSSMSITTKEHYPDGDYNAVVQILSSKKMVKLWINGKPVGYKSFDKLHNIGKQEYIYLGVGDPERDYKNNWLDGSISQFALYNYELENSVVEKMSADNMVVEHGKLLLHYDSQEDFTQSRGIKSQEAILVNTHLKDTAASTTKDVAIPIRAKGTFKALSHTENGYTDGYWKEWGSRENQIEYYKRYYSTRAFHYFDGLSRLEYEDIDYKFKDSYHLYRVKL